MYLFLDTETTGINKASDRVIQIAWLLTNKFGETIQETDYIIKPDGFYIPSRATSIHGISTELAKKNGLNLNKVLAELSDISKKANYVIAHNIQFDLNFLKKEFELERIKYPFNYHLQICTMQSAVSHCRLAKLNGMPGFKRPTLQELHFKLFKKYFDNAHDALADTEACKRCFFELKRVGLYPNINEMESSIESSQNKEKYKQDDRNSILRQTHNQIDNLNINEKNKNEEVLISLKAELEVAKVKITLLEKEIEFYNSDDGLFIRASISGDIEWRKALARHPKTSVKLLIEICLNLENEFDENLAICLIQNESLPSDYIQFLIEEVNEGLSTYAAKNASCNAELLAQIVWSDFNLLETVKLNKSYSYLVLESLLQKNAVDKNEEIRSLVAEFNECPQYLLKALSFDQDIGVRINVAKNISSNTEIVLRLADDDNEWVRYHALNNHNHPKKKSELYLDKISVEIDKAIQINDVQKLKSIALHENADIILMLVKKNIVQNIF